MRKHILLLIGLFAAFSFVAAACGSDSDEESTDETDEEAMEDSDEESTGEALKSLDAECSDSGSLELPEDFNVVLVTDIGKVDDGTFNQFAFEGMEGAADCFGFTDATSFIETVSEADYANNIAAALESEPEVIVTVGFLLATDTLAAAQANPEVKFVGVDQFQVEYPENYVGVLFNEHEGGYMAGVLAASMSESGTIGVVAGREDVPPVVKYVNGYEAGAKSVNADINVISIYNESFGDPAKGSSDAEQMIGEGADVIFGAGGPTGSGGVAAATADGVWGIGVDQDEYFTTFDGGTAPGSEFLISSAMKRVDLSVFRNVQGAIDGTFAADGNIFVLTAANSGITYAPFHDADVNDAAASATEAARLGLADGSVDTGVCGIDGLFVGEGSACD